METLIQSLFDASIVLGAFIGVAAAVTIIYIALRKFNGDTE